MVCFFTYLLSTVICRCYWGSSLGAEKLIFEAVGRWRVSSLFKVVFRLPIYIYLIICSCQFGFIEIYLLVVLHIFGVCRYLFGYYYFMFVSANWDVSDRLFARYGIRFLTFHWSRVLGFLRYEWRLSGYFVCSRSVHLQCWLDVMQNVLY